MAGFGGKKTAPYRVDLQKATVGLALALSLTLVAARPATAGNPFDAYVPLLGVGDRAPTTSLVDQEGRHVSLSGFRGKTVIVSFIYTNCTDVCPLISSKFGRLQAALTPGRFHLVEISVDPARDTRSTITRYARRFHADPARWSILTGSTAALTKLWRALGESVIPGAHGEVIHNDRTIVVAPDGTIAEIIDEAGWTVPEMVAEARAVAGKPSRIVERADLELGKAVGFVCGGFQSGRAGLADLLGTIAILVGFGMILYFAGKKFSSLPD